MFDRKRIFFRQVCQTGGRYAFPYVGQVKSEHRRDVPEPDTAHDATRGRGRAKIHANEDQQYASQCRDGRGRGRTNPAE